MTASMGVAYYPNDAPNVIDLIRNADAALYHAKKDGGNTSSYYAPEMNEASVERLMTKSKLKRAFERDELFVHYQPKYNLKTGEVFGAEALVRWELPERGIVLPPTLFPSQKRPASLSKSANGFSIRSAKISESGKGPCPRRAGYRSTCRCDNCGNAISSSISGPSCGATRYRRRRSNLKSQKPR